MSTIVEMSGATLEKSHKKQYHINILSSLCVVLTQDILFYAVKFQERYHGNPFAIDDAYLTPLYQHVQ